jgi:hypothetical protein
MVLRNYFGPRNQQHKGRPPRESRTLVSDTTSAKRNQPSRGRQTKMGHTAMPNASRAAA